MRKRMSVELLDITAPVLALIARAGIKVDLMVDDVSLVRNLLGNENLTALELAENLASQGIEFVHLKKLDSLSDGGASLVREALTAINPVPRTGTHLRVSEFNGVSISTAVLYSLFPKLKEQLNFKPFIIDKDIDIDVVGQLLTSQELTSDTTAVHVNVLKAALKNATYYDELNLYQVTLGQALATKNKLVCERLNLTENESYTLDDDVVYILNTVPDALNIDELKDACAALVSADQYGTFSTSILEQLEREGVV